MADYKFRNVIPNSNLRLEVAQGNIAGLATMGRFGSNPSIAAATPEDCIDGGGTYAGFPTGAAETMEVLSSDIDDTSAGAGARTVKVSGLLDGTGLPMPDITVALNGLTPVSLGAATYGRASKVEVLTAGATGSNEGVITVRHTTTTANIFAALPIGKNESQMAIYTVPLAKTLYLDHAAARMAVALGIDGSAAIAIMERVDGGLWVEKRTPQITQAQGYEMGESEIMVFAALTDIKVRADVTVNATAISAELSGYLIDN